MDNNSSKPVPTPPICWVLFDYGGVVAEEGFKDYFAELSERYGRPRHELPQLALDTVYDSGYVTGQADQAHFWSLLRERFPLNEKEIELTAGILRHFQLRRSVLTLVDELHGFGFRTGILSDQTDWLDMLDRRDDLFSHFDRVFNSYYLG
ncbi:MAG: hydrolase, partial [Phycisphaerae bacterium]|nr:hydrolase [candidate division KSB1 bacterium]NIV69730.1 hydrolase [Phycisphaerae bacterium]